MAFTFNGNTPEIVTFNGNDVLVVKWNGTVVWEKNTMPNCLAFIATSNGTFTFVGSDRTNRISYSIDSGATWSTEAVNVSVDVNSGDIVLWKGELVTQGYYNGGVGNFGGTATFEAQGNIMSILYGDNYEGQTESTSIEGGDFYGLFADTNIENAENLELPMTELTDYCYQYMFSGCTLLETAPTLSAETLVDGCYDNMFNGCSSLSYIKMLATDITATDCLNNWVADVAESGTFVKSADMTTLPIDSVNGIPIGWTVEDDAIDYSKKYLTFVATSGGTFNFSGTTTANTISYSTDSGTTWSTPARVVTVNVNNGDTVMWKGEMTPTNNGIGRFSGSTASFDAQGNIMSLLYGDNFIGITNLSGKNYAFIYLFKGSTTISAASDLILPATTLVTSAYTQMFYGCSNLTTTPQLPATTMAAYCYQRMFEGCSKITTAPSLPATTLAIYCYANIFNNCRALVTPPSILPATTLAAYCYGGMFAYCTSLTTAPVLSATTLETYCYESMFYGSSKINYIKMLATDISASHCLMNWTYGVASTGTFVKAASMTTLPTGTSGIPRNWNVENATE